MGEIVETCDKIDEETKAIVKKSLQVDENQEADISNFLALFSGESLHLAQEKSQTLKKLYDFAVNEIKELCSKTEQIVEENAI